MADKTLLTFLASLLVVQTVHGQYQQVQQISSIPVGFANYGVQNQLQGLQLTNGGQQFSLGTGSCGNLGNGAVNSLGYSSVQSLPYQPVEALSVASGSPYGPGGISVVADNLEIGGQVAVSGSMPFYGAVSINGNLPSTGQGLVQYNSAPGLGISSGGCGYGLASAVPNNGGLGGSANGLSGLVGYSGNAGGIGGIGLPNGGSCACNLY